MKIFEQIGDMERAVFWVKAWGLARSKRIAVLTTSKHALPQEATRYLRCERRIERAMQRFSGNVVQKL